MLAVGYPTLFIRRKLAVLELDDEQLRKLRAAIMPMHLR